MPVEISDSFRIRFCGMKRTAKRANRLAEQRGTHSSAFCMPSVSIPTIKGGFHETLWIWQRSIITQGSSGNFNCDQSQLDQNSHKQPSPLEDGFALMLLGS